MRKFVYNNRSDTRFSFHKTPNQAEAIVLLWLFIYMVYKLLINYNAIIAFQFSIDIQIDFYYSIAEISCFLI